MNKYRISLSVLTAFVLLLTTACSDLQQGSPFLSAEPPEDSVQTRSPRTLRLYFAALPDASRSEVILTGPAGELNLRGLHTMGANDLMMEIYDEVVNGSYTVQWQTRFEGNDALYSGNYSFSVQAE